MRSRVFTAALVCVAVVWAFVPVPHAHAQGPGRDNRPLDPKVQEWDRGIDKIDVSKYPADMKAKYKVFADLCSRCHTLARPINCDFVLDDEWERYIKKMMRRGGRLIRPDEAQEIFDFLIYDSKVRKKALYEAKLAASKQ